MNLPNKLTLSRIIAIPFVMAGLLIDNFCQYEGLTDPAIISAGRYFALVLFIAATITDLYDGKIARKRKIVTPFGCFFDPIADKLLVSAVLICFVEMHIMPAWMVIIIICREFIISGLRILSARKGIDIPAGPLGKYKTVSQMVMIIGVLLYIAAMSSYGILIRSIILGKYSLDNWIFSVLYVLMIWTVIATIVSGVSYIKNHWELIIEGAQ